MTAQEFLLQQKEKIRVYTLARELDMESKDLLDMCRQAGMDIKNQLSSLDPEQRDQILLLVKRSGSVAVSAPPKPATPVLSQPTQPMRNLASPRPAPPRPLKPEPTPPSVPTASPPPVPLVSPVVEAPRPPAVVEPPAAEPAPVVPAAAAELPTEPPEPEDTAPPPATSTEPPTATPPPVEAVPRVAADLGARMRNLGGSKPGEGTARPRRTRPTMRPVVSVAKSTTSRTAKPVEEKKPVQPAVQKPLQYLPADMAQGKQPVNLKELTRQPAKPGAPAVPGAPTGPVGDETDDDGKGKGARPGGVVGRDKRHQQRAARTAQRKGREGETTRHLLTGDDERTRHHKNRYKALKKKQDPTKPRLDNKVPIVLPITVRSLSEALGVRAPDLLFKLKDHGITGAVTINSTLDPLVAETLAIDYGRELDIKRPLDTEEELLKEGQKPDNPEDLVPRAPIVTIMGHVDHGKTSLLDRIRASNVAATEAGGITQVIRAWRVEHHGKPITFLDTPGHEAFTKMRARGANVTDIAVIVVAADDGVMPQTEEAIAHARAAGVSLVIAINKVDLPNANLNKTRQQLYSLSVLPDNMGGDVPFVETSAATGKGIDELLEMISVVAELKDLKANPNKSAKGVCLEAMLSEGQGVQATLLVQDGTLRRGDVVLCGAAFGRVRAMYSDLGQPLEEAGPSVPVRITGLDQVPNADDVFQVADDLATAREIADKRKDRQQEASMVRREPVRLENLSATQIAELKVILKADFRGSIEAIRKELEKLRHDEVRVRVLEAAIGGITENDVWLALTSPQDTIIVGFNVVPDDRARAVAEERGVSIRLYNIIYNLTDDVRSALEGKLKPREEVVHLGRAVVRETFKISRVGTIAGCYVTQGVIERSAKVRLIREGVVIYPPADRTASLESLKRFKDDAREAREGFECGLKIAGYDDVKVGDVVEAFRVEQVLRTLDNK